MKFLKNNFATSVTIVLSLCMIVIAVLNYQVDEESLQFEKQKYEAGSIPPKRLLVYSLGPQSIGGLDIFTSDEIQSKLIVGGREFDKLYRINYRIANGGTSPFLPEDFIKPLSVRFSDRWEIVCINNIGFAEDNAKPNWVKENNHSLRLDSTLLNSKDIIEIDIYVADTGSDEVKWDELDKKLKGIWSVRAKNLKKIETMGNQETFDFLNIIYPLESKKWQIPEFAKAFYTAGFFISHSSWGVYFILAIAAIISFSFVYLTTTIWNIRGWSKGKISIIITVICLLSFSFAESYFTLIALKMKDVDLLNYLLVTIHLISTGYIVDTAIKKKKLEG